MEPNSAVETCAVCPLCKFTRRRIKKNIFYNIARRVQNICPNCKEANKVAGRDLQKSSFF